MEDCTNCVQTGCQWCNNTCISNKTCSGHSAASLSQCPYNTCLATDCIQCNQLPGCFWSVPKRQCTPRNY